MADRQHRPRYVKRLDTSGSSRSPRSPGREQPGSGRSDRESRPVDTSPDPGDVPPQLSPIPQSGESRSPPVEARPAVPMPNPAFLGSSDTNNGDDYSDDDTPARSPAEHAEMSSRIERRERGGPSSGAVPTHIELNVTGQDPLEASPKLDKGRGLDYLRRTIRAKVMKRAVKDVLNREYNRDKIFHGVKDTDVRASTSAFTEDSGSPEAPPSIHVPASMKGKGTVHPTADEVEAPQRPDTSGSQLPRSASLMRGPFISGGNVKKVEWIAYAKAYGEEEDVAFKAFWEKKTNWFAKMIKFIVYFVRYAIFWQNAVIDRIFFRRFVDRVTIKFGQGISQYFRMAKFLVKLNFGMALLWGGLVMLHWKDAKPEHYDDCTPFNEKEDLIALVKGSGLEHTWFFYGGYRQGSGDWDMQLWYTVTIILSILLSIFVLVSSIATRLKYDNSDSLTGTPESVNSYKFSTAVFGGYDFGIQGKKHIRRMQVTIANVLKEGVAELQQKQKTQERKCLAFRRVLGVLLCVAVLGGSIVTIYWVSENAEDLKERFQYLDAIVITGANLIGTEIILRIVKFVERWQKIGTEIQQQVIRVYLLKMFNVCFIALRFTSVSNAQLPTDPCSAVSDPICPETFTGELIWRLLITEMGVTMAVSLFAAVGKRVILRKRGEFIMAKNVLDSLYRQALVWLGMLVSPMTPVLGVVSHFIIFYWKYFLMFPFFQVPDRLYSDSKASSFIHMLLLLTLVLTSAVAGVFLNKDMSDATTPCVLHLNMTDRKGSEFSTPYGAIATRIDKAEKVARKVFGLVLNPMVLGLVIIVLSVILLFQMAVIFKYRKTERKLEREIHLERHDKISLLRDALVDEEAESPASLPRRGSSMVMRK